MKTLYYCMGGGLGHITRYAAFCYTTGAQPALITNCPAALCKQISIPAETLFIPDSECQQSKSTFRNWIAGLLAREKPDKLIIDSFPAGILGELSGLALLDNIECEYLARILKLPDYMKRVVHGVPKFAKVYLLEKLLPDQYRFMENFDGITEFSLLDKPVNQPHALSEHSWMIIHSGNNEEIEQLWLFARQTAAIERTTPNFVVISPGSRPDFLPATINHFDLYPAHSLLARAKRVFSAAGFNIMRQMRGLKVKHEVLPFNRALDDQFFRAASHRPDNNSHR